MIKAKTADVAKASGGMLTIKVDFFDDASPNVVVDSDTYAVSPTQDYATVLIALISEGINQRRATSAVVAEFNQSVPVGYVIG